MRTLSLLCFSILFVFALPSAATARDDGGGERRPNAGKGGVESKRRFPPLFERLTDAERAELRRLRSENPEAFKAKLRSLAAKYGRKGGAEDKEKIKKIVARIRKAKGEERKKLIQELRERVKAEFERRMKLNWENYKKAEKRLAELKRKLKLREEKKKEVVDDRVEDLIKDPALKW